MANLTRATREIRERGPTRVAINSTGEATTPFRAKEEHGIVPTVVFLRNDGWTLGAPEHLRVHAQGMWSDAWVAVMEDYPGGEFKSLQE